MVTNGLTINQEKELRRRRQVDTPASPKVNKDMADLYELVSQYRKMQKARGMVSAAIKHDQLKAIDECLKNLRPIFYQKP